MYLVVENHSGDVFKILIPNDMFYALVKNGIECDTRLSIGEIQRIKLHGVLTIKLYNRDVYIDVDSISAYNNYSGTENIPYESLVNIIIGTDEYYYTSGNRDNIDCWVKKQPLGLNRNLPQIEETKINKQKGDSNMKTQLMGNMGKRLEGITGISIMDGSPAVKLKQGWFTFNKETSEILDVSEFIMEFDMPCIVMPAQELEVGDLLYTNDGLVFVTKKPTEKSKTVETINGDGEVKRLVKVGNLMFPNGMYMKVMNPLSNMTGLGGSSDNNFNPMMLMLLSDKKDGGSKDMLDMMIFSQMMGGKGLIG